MKIKGDPLMLVKAAGVVLAVLIGGGMFIVAFGMAAQGLLGM